MGLGASAGGLEALSELLAKLPQDPGVAIVVIQHLDPHHETKLSTLLSRVSRMPVLEAEQDMAVRRDHVYVIPKNTTMTIAKASCTCRPEMVRMVCTCRSTSF